MTMELMCVCTGGEAEVCANGQAAYYSKAGLDTDVKRIDEEHVGVWANGSIAKTTKVVKFK